METTSLFSAVSFVAVFIYMYIGLYTFNQNRTSIIHKVFLALCISYSIWSFAYAFAYISNDRYVFSFWNKISAIGWCSFSSISLYLVLLICGKIDTKNKVGTALIFSPAVIFLYMSVFLFGEGINTPAIISSIFYIGDFLYNFIFLLVSIIVLLFWGLKTDKIRIKKQAQILVISSIIPFLLNLITQHIFPIIGVKQFPLMGQIYSLIMIIGTYKVITRYKFLRLPEEFILVEVANEMMDMVIILNEDGKIIRVSKHTLTLLEFSKNELLNKEINFIIDKNDYNKVLFDDMKICNNKFNDINLLKKNGERIPVNISTVAIIDNKIHDFLGVILVIQDISIIYELKRKNEELSDKAIKDGLTKLYNHQYSIELINKAIENEILTIIMIDIDYFKRVNDTFGHQYGDYVLENISMILMNNINNIGYVGRFGGEEFVIILPQIRINEAHILGEKIRKEIQEFNFNKDLKLTVSLGIAQHTDESSMELVKKADDLLYKAKKNGRNRIEL